jgi:hypothetical protein
VRKEYLLEEFPKYLKGKEKAGALPPSFSELALDAIEQRLLAPGRELNPS